MSRPGLLLRDMRVNGARLETIAQLTARLDRAEAAIAAMATRLERLEAGRDGEGDAYEAAALIG